jgi:hypothetical protein
MHRTPKWLGLVALVVVVALGAAIAQTSAGHELFRSAGLSEEPTSYTSLAFLHPQSLPKQFKSKRTSAQISFVIGNDTSASRDYQWKVLVEREGRIHIVGAGGASVASERTTEIKRSVNFSCIRERVRVVVSITHPAESIEAWIQCWSPRR